MLFINYIVSSSILHCAMGMTYILRLLQNNFLLLDLNKPVLVLDWFWFFPSHVSKLTNLSCLSYKRDLSHGILFWSVTTLCKLCMQLCRRCMLRFWRLPGKSSKQLPGFDVALHWWILLWEIDSSNWLHHPQFHSWGRKFRFHSFIQNQKEKNTCTSGFFQF